MSEPIDRAEALIQRATELPQGERAAFLERECAGLETIAFAMLLLRRHEDSESPSGAPAETKSVEHVGSFIGRFKLVEHIGDGGFGTVYLAEQTHPIVRQVALKIIKLGMDTKQVVARFEAERQALALMEHPNIAKVLDGGATSAGRPYFVMELVRGVTITEYCDQHHLSVRERLLLFIDVCAAVQHAHQKGIVHRDIKPTNVMVTLHDGKPVPKVIDFGIAKAMHGRLTERTLLTEEQQFIGTPAYMSPEQMSMSAVDIDTRSDIYSLGVLLYELLTGTTPFDVRLLLQWGVEKLRSSIREVDPPPPSQRIAAQDSTEVARRRRVDSGVLRRTLSGDLDWIAMKALEKDRARRYDTAAALAADVQRHLDDEPVLARPPSRAYRSLKFVRRHRVVVTAGVLVVLALVAGVVGTSHGLAEAVRERENAKEQAAQAVSALDESEAVTTFLTDMFEAVHPDEAGRDVTVREVLGGASERLDGAFPNRPGVEARLHSALGGAYLQLGQLSEADEHLPDAVELRRASLGGDHPQTLKAIVNLAALRLEQGKNEDAEVLLRAAVEGLTRTVGEDDPMTLGALSNLAVARARRSPDAEALALQQRVVDAQRRVRGPEHPDTLGAISNYADLLVTLGRGEEAEPLARETAATWERVHGPKKPGTLLALQNWAMMQVQSGRFDEAEALLARVLDGRIEVLGESHPDTLGTRVNLGVARSRRGDPAGAQAAWLPAWKGLRASLGDAHPTTLSVAGSLVQSFERLGWPQSGAAVVADVVASARSASQRADLSPSSLNDLAWLFTIVRPAELSDPAAAVVLARRACELDRSAGGANTWMYLDTLASAQHAVGDPSAAMESQREALQRMPAAYEHERAGMEERLRKYEAAASH